MDAGRGNVVRKICLCTNPEFDAVPFGTPCLLPEKVGLFPDLVLGRGDPDLLSGAEVLAEDVVNEAAEETADIFLCVCGFHVVDFKW